MSQQQNVLDRQLHTFATEELSQIKRLADTIFEPLVRPFRQHRVTEEFSFRQTLKTCMKIGQLLPSYVRREHEHRKSRLVIFMSLSGIDRCSAVSLIPLFGCLQKTALNFRLFVYTDNVIEAEFTSDGFLANDWKLAWNNVAAPVVFDYIRKTQFDEKEDTLLLIDSLGGGDSQWFYTWGSEEREEVRREQQKYLATGGRYSWANRIRQQINGDFNKINSVELPEQWHKLVDNNCNKRWMETPALKEYMIRWLFHPQFGTVKHGQSSLYNSSYDLIGKLRGKFKSMHLLTPNLEDYSYNLENIKNMNVFDYHHKANTVRGFAEVLASIVHGNAVFDGPYTRKISYEKVKLGVYSEENPDDFVQVEEDKTPGDHTELVEGTENCFVKCQPVDQKFPKETKIVFSKRNRNLNTLTSEEVAFSEVDVDDFFPKFFQHLDPWWEKLINPLKIEDGDSQYTRTMKAQMVLDEIKNNHLVCSSNYGGLNSLVKKPRTRDGASITAISERIEYAEHHTKLIKQDVDDLLELIAPCYYRYMDDLPLKHVVWCTEGKFVQDKMAISVKLKDSRLDKRITAWHEALHWVEAICPPVGAFTNNLIRRKCGGINLKKLVVVGDGERAMPVQDGSTDWIIPYAGKWYKRKTNDLPNNTEILSVHGSYFNSKESLVELMRHDLFMVRFIAFILMGGPVAAMQALENLKKQKALSQINQKDRGGRGYKVSRSRGGGRRSSSSGRYQPRKNQGFGL